MELEPSADLEGSRGGDGDQVQGEVAVVEARCEHRGIERAACALEQPIPAGLRGYVATVAVEERNLHVSVRRAEQVVDRLNTHVCEVEDADLRAGRSQSNVRAALDMGRPLPQRIKAGRVRSDLAGKRERR